MPAFEHHFSPLEPPLEGDSHKELESQGLIVYQTNSGFELLVRYLCLDEEVRVIAITVPAEAAAHPDMNKWMKQIVEISIAAIRLSVNPDAAPLLTPRGSLNLMYQSDDPEPAYPVKITYPRNPDYKLDIRNVLGVFEAISSRTLATISALVAEAQVRAIPPHYRVLSVIRAIELLYTDKSERSEALDLFDMHFHKLAISDSPFRNALPQLRTRCAHGLSKGRKNPEPFVGIGYNEPHLPQLLELLQSVVAHGLQSLHGLELGGVRHKLGDADAKSAEQISAA